MHQNIVSRKGYTKMLLGKKTCQSVVGKKSIHQNVVSKKSKYQNTILL